MIAIRQVARQQPALPRDEFIKQLALQLGNKRLGSKNRKVLSGHVRAAVRRQILQSYAGEIESWKIKIDHFTDDDLRAALTSVTRRGTTYARPDLMRLIAHHLGFAKLTAAIQTRLKSTLNSALRRSIIERISATEIQRT